MLKRVPHNLEISLQGSAVASKGTGALAPVFSADDLVNPLGEMIRAVVRTRAFPKRGKLARQIFCWKDVGVRNNLDNCKTVTTANIILKLAESCVKSSATAFCKTARFPRPYWGHFYGAPYSIYVWLSTV